MSGHGRLRQLANRPESERSGNGQRGRETPLTHRRRERQVCGGPRLTISRRKLTCSERATSSLAEPHARIRRRAASVPPRSQDWPDV
jgi:hypothetical protein